MKLQTFLMKLIHNYCNLNGSCTADYIQSILHWYMPNIYLDCEQYVDICLKYRMHKIYSEKIVVKFIRSKKAYERYKVDLVEISKELNSINILIY